MVLHPDMEVQQRRIAVEHGLETTAGIFAEHEVGGVQAREFLLVFPFDRSLDRAIARPPRRRPGR